jgi:hypothetical protein
MKSTEQLIQENIGRFQVTCKQIDKGLIERSELIATREEVLKGNIKMIDNTDKYIQSLRRQLNFNNQWS